MGRWDGQMGQTGRWPQIGQSTWMRRFPRVEIVEVEVEVQVEEEVEVEVEVEVKVEVEVEMNGGRDFFSPIPYQRPKRRKDSGRSKPDNRTDRRHRHPRRSRPTPKKHDGATAGTDRYGITGYHTIP